MVEQTRNGSLASVARAITLVELMTEHRGLTLTEIARHLDMGKTTVLRLAKTLIERGWLMKDEQLRYHIGPGFLRLASEPDGRSDLRNLLHPLMEELREETRETIHLTVIQGRHVVYIDQLISPQPVHSVSTLGSRSPAHCVSPGLAQMSLLPNEQVNWILSGPLHRYTDQTLLSPEAIWDELEVVHERGYAINRGAFRAEVGGVGAAITNFKGQPIAALSVCMPTYRMKSTDLGNVGQILRGAVVDINRRPELLRISSRLHNEFLPTSDFHEVVTPGIAQ